MSMVQANIDPMRLNEILNKKPKDLVTSEEWNEIFNLLVTQGNYLSQNYTRIDKLIEDLVLGKIPTVSVNYDVTHFGGKLPSEYASGDDLKAINTDLTNKINLKQDAYLSGYEKIVVTTQDGRMRTTEKVGTADLAQLEGITSNIQTQLNNKLNNDATAANTIKVAGKKVHIQQTAPSSPTTGDVWISW